jgi:hypothetical protein
LNLEFSLDESIHEVMATIDKIWEDMHHRSYFLPKLEYLEVGMQILVSGQGAFSESSSEILSLNQIESMIPFLELAIELSTAIHAKDKCLIPFPCLYGHHQGDTIAPETT